MAKPIISVQVDVRDSDPGYRNLIERLTSDASHVDVGIHPVSGEEMVKIASAHEFGASINHPGGQPYIIVDARKRKGRQTRAQREGHVPLGNGKEMIFLPKGRKGMGVTKPHTIKIPMRSFIRSTVDENRSAYTREAGRLWDQVLSGHSRQGSPMNVRLALGLMGQRMERDIRNKIRNLRTPPNAPETARRKGSDNPLVDTGTMLNSVRYAVKNPKDEVVDMSPQGHFSAPRGARRGKR